jgi:hypothetical protein
VVVVRYFQVVAHVLKHTATCKAGRGFGLVVRAAGWHVNDPGSILGRDGLNTFECIPQAP